MSAGKLPNLLHPTNFLHFDYATRSEEEMRRNHATQKAENQKTQAAIAVLKTEKTNLHQHLLDLRRRIAELELMIGEE